ncbi:AbiH family protein [Anaerotignum propionicum]|uniref:AbiH family protein n=1 Tax=Anaerotignum propionicum TaxID=28446 RepID=UPI00289A0624|nr:AbiH family protein [Anaerotignum propionicum]
MNLNIIGNGFDLYHGLPSSYYYFGCYLIENDPDLYMALSKWFRFRYYSQSRGYPYEDFEYGVEEQFWTEFEERLGIVDETVIIDSYDSDLDLEIEDYDIPMEDDKIAEEIRKSFIAWVSSTLDVKENYKVIKKNKKILINKEYYKLGFSNSDRYLVFNYTHVLQNIYGIQPKNIYYVHGECTNYENDKLIFGHGNKERISEIQEIINDYDNRSLYQSEKTRQLEYKCLLRFMENLEKDVDWCKLRAGSFYNHLTEVPETINVYGMSLGDVDYPYFEQIRKKWPDIKWNFSYYSKQDEDRINLLVNRLTLPKYQYTKFKFENPKFKDIMDIIIKNINIALYEKVERK